MTEIPESHGHGFHAPIPLTKKIGPLPVWVYGILIVGGIVGFVWWRQNTSGDSSTPLSNADPAASGAASGYAGVAADGTDNSDAPSGSSANPTTGNVYSPTGNGVTSNAQWGIDAVQELIATGHSAIAASTAIANYLNRKPLNTAQNELVSIAIGLIGPPPQGILGSVSPTTAPPATKHSIYNPIRPVHYIHQRSTNRYWQVWGDGSRHILSPADYAALGRPRATDFGEPAPKHVRKQSGKTSTAHKVDKHPKSHDKHQQNHHYTVKPGDTLGSIAHKFYGNKNEWRKIRNANANHLRNNVGENSNIENGKTLVIPN